MFFPELTKEKSRETEEVSAGDKSAREKLAREKSPREGLPRGALAKSREEVPTEVVLSMFRV